MLENNKNALHYAKGLHEELCIMIKDYLDFKSELTYEQACKLVDLRAQLSIVLEIE
jgi:hypothetical protein